jgi:hypothetical protein
MRYLFILTRMGMIKNKTKSRKITNQGNNKNASEELKAGTQ